MAVIGIHKEVIAYPEIWLALLKFCKSVQYLNWQDDDIIVYRVQGEELPEEDVMCTFELSIHPGIMPFVIKVNNSEQKWQPLST